MVKGDANFLVEVRAEKGDLGVPLTEVVQHDEPLQSAHEGLYVTVDCGGSEGQGQIRK